MKKKQNTPPKNFNVIFSADLHGNINQYDKLFKITYEKKTDLLILGGDLTPKDLEHRTIKDQKQFIEKELFPRIKKLNQDNKKRDISTQILLMLGNDDFRENEKVLKKNQSKIGFKLINKKIIRINSEFVILGYSYVPLTPFKYKDWEKLDLTKINENKTRKGFITEGIISKKGKFIPKKINLEDRKDTIEKDLKNLFNKIKNKKIIFVSHSPPYNTNLDIITNGEHVGSRAITNMINQKKPYLTLHGHVHETVKISGSFKDKIGKTLCLSAGNDNNTDTISLIEFDIKNLAEIKRIIY